MFDIKTMHSIKQKYSMSNMLCILCSWFAEDDINIGYK
jgi:hypothetical protein